MVRSLLSRGPSRLKLGSEGGNHVEKVAPLYLLLALPGGQPRRRRPAGSASPAVVRRAAAPLRGGPRLQPDDALRRHQRPWPAGADRHRRPHQLGDRGGAGRADARSLPGADDQSARLAAHRPAARAPPHRGRAGAPRRRPLRRALTQGRPLLLDRDRPRRGPRYVTVRSTGSGRPDALWGDYFVVDPDQDFAGGENLVDIDRTSGCGSLSLPSCPALPVRRRLRRRHPDRRLDRPRGPALGEPAPARDLPRGGPRRGLR